jgi:hypothetical protein
VLFLEKDCREFCFSSLTNGISGEPLNIHGSEISLTNYSSTPVMFAKICVKFCSPSYGHFNVTIVFDFGFAPRIVRYVGVVVAPEKHLFEKLSSPPTTTSNDKHNELTWTQKYKLVSFDGSTTGKCGTNSNSNKCSVSDMDLWSHHFIEEYKDLVSILVLFPKTILFLKNIVQACFHQHCYRLGVFCYVECRPQFIDIQDSVGIDK